MPAALKQYNEYAIPINHIRNTVQSRIEAGISTKGDRWPLVSGMCSRIQVAEKIWQNSMRGKTNHLEDF